MTRIHDSMQGPTSSRRRAAARFLAASLVGALFFFAPVSYRGRSTVPFDVAVKVVLHGWPAGVSFYGFLLILVGALATLAAVAPGPVGASAKRLLGSRHKDFAASPLFVVLRVAGALVAVSMFFRIGPWWLTEPAARTLMWNILMASVAVIIPLGAAALALLAGFGALEFVGVLAEPVMGPLYHLPGRSALDDLTSWMGSYSVGLYLTRNLMRQGLYTKRQAFVIATCFSTVSMGFVAVVASTLHLLPLFALIVGTYFVAIHLTAVIMVRIWPTSSIPERTIDGTAPLAGRSSNEQLTRHSSTDQDDLVPSGSASGSSRWRRAWSAGTARAGRSQGIVRAMGRSAVDGLFLASTILGTILAVGTAALLLARHTPVFHWLGRPLEPLYALAGFAHPSLLAQASLAGITEMYIPALLAQGASMQGRFFIAVLSVSQLIFFSSVGPMMVDMFREVPIRFRHLVVLFVIRTAVLIPLLMGWTKLLALFGVFS